MKKDAIFAVRHAVAAFLQISDRKHNYRGLVAIMEDMENVIMGVSDDGTVSAHVETEIGVLEVKVRMKEEWE